MKAILVIDMPTDCVKCNQFAFECCHAMKREIENECIVQCKRPSWCPLKHPLKYASNDFYIYDTKYLMENLDREINLLKGTKHLKKLWEKQNE